MGIKHGLVRCQTPVGFDNHFVICLPGGVAEVERFDAAGLLEESICLGIGGNELGSLVSVFRGDVMTDGTAFVKDEAVVVLKKMIISVNPSYREIFRTHDVRNLTKRMFLDIFWTLVLALLEVDAVKLERHLLLVKYYGNTTCVGGEDIAVEFENHGVDDRLLQRKKGFI